MILFYFTKFIKIKRLIQLTTDPIKRRLLYYQVYIFINYSFAFAVLSARGFVRSRFCPFAVLSARFCPRGFVLSRFCPDTFWRGCTDRRTDISPMSKPTFHFFNYTVRIVGSRNRLSNDKRTENRTDRLKQFIKYRVSGEIPFQQKKRIFKIGLYRGRTVGS